MHSQIKSTYIIHKNPQRGTKSSKTQIIPAKDSKCGPLSLSKTVHFLCLQMMDDFEMSLIHFWQSWVIIMPAKTLKRSI